MSRTCTITGKKPQRGYQVSHAHNKSKKVWNVNLQQKRLFNAETGKWVRVKLSCRALRTISKNGVAKTLAEATK